MTTKTIFSHCQCLLGEGAAPGRTSWLRPHHTLALLVRHLRSEQSVQLTSHPGGSPHEPTRAGTLQHLLTQCVT
jgi:hypothetical protein